MNGNRVDAEANASHASFVEHAVATSIWVECVDVLCPLWINFNMILNILVHRIHRTYLTYKNPKRNTKPIELIISFLISLRWIEYIWLNKIPNEMNVPYT